MIPAHCVSVKITDFDGKPLERKPQQQCAEQGRQLEDKPLQRARHYQNNSNPDTPIDGPKAKLL